jgi:hypothetical protein
MVTTRKPIVSSRNTGTVILRAPTLHQTTNLGEDLAPHSEKPTGSKISWDFFHSTANIGQFLLVKTRRFRIFSFSSAEPVIRNPAQNSVLLRGNDNSISYKAFRHTFFHDAYFSKGLQTNAL